MNHYRESKEEIKDRMIQTALRFWNIKNIENLDPLIRLLIEALSEQLHEVSDNIADIETRTMQRLSEVLLPDAVIMAKPAHAIANIEPKWEKIQTSQEACFYTKNPFPNRKIQNRYAFYPACKTPLHRATIKKIICAADVYEVTPDFNKRLIFRTEVTPENHNKIWVGLSFESVLANLQNFSFYINFPNIDRRNDYLKWLSYADWSFNKIKINVRNGIHNVNQYSQEDTLDHFFENQNFNERMNHRILDFYTSNYVTIDQPLEVSREKYTCLPTADEKTLQLWQEEASFVFSEKLLWIEITVPQTFKPHIISDIQIAINTVPVVNKELHTTNHTIQKGLAIIPLEMKAEESFLGMISLSDDKNQLYHRSYGFKSTSTHNYTLRQGGTEAFDFRNAKELLIKLQSLLEDEANVFSSLKTASSENILLIERLINRLERDVSVQQTMGKELLYYIFLDRVYSTSHFFVRYWTTLGEAANGMRIGTSLTSEEQSFEQTSDAVLITPTLGGTPPPSERERIAQFKFLLNSRGRVVTNHDIRTFCLAEFPDIVSDVRIEQGICIGTLPGQGLVRTIDVHLIPLGEVKEKQLVMDTIHNQLAKHSPMTFNYRIFID